MPNPFRPEKRIRDKSPHTNKRKKKGWEQKKVKFFPVAFKGEVSCQDRGEKRQKLRESPKPLGSLQGERERKRERKKEREKERERKRERKS